MLSKPHILVCTDFSVYSVEALKTAENLRRKTGGKLTVLHVSEHPVLWDWMSLEGAATYFTTTFERDLINSLRKKLVEHVQMLEAHGDTIVAMGIPSAVISEEIVAKKIDLVVMGHKGRSAGSFHLGSVAQKMAATSPVPLLVVKGQFVPDKIAALVDPTGPMKGIIQSAEELSYLFSSQLEVVSIIPEMASKYIGFGTIIERDLVTYSEEQRKEIADTIKKRIQQEVSPEIHAVIKVEVTDERKVAFHLNAILESDKINFAVMKRHQAGFLEKIMIGSETRRMLEIFNGNIFVVPP